MQSIKYIDADNGGISLFAGIDKSKYTSSLLENFKGWANNPAALAYYLKTTGFDCNNYSLNFLSSMDFATEYGFKSDMDAWILWNNTLQYLKEDKPDATT
tara:strand:+ start:188 stop:487 length:300 start_codon:yes stop_codon:yes gene_type:complete